jgi:hypothetical protein
MILSTLAIMVGFTAGFFCSVFGGINKNPGLLGVGIAFVGLFVIGMVMMITSAVGVQKHQRALLMAVMGQNLDGVR